MAKRTQGWTLKKGRLEPFLPPQGIRFAQENQWVVHHGTFTRIWPTPPEGGVAHQVQIAGAAGEKPASL